MKIRKGNEEEEKDEQEDAPSLGSAVSESMKTSRKPGDLVILGLSTYYITDYQQISVGLKSQL